MFTYAGTISRAGSIATASRHLGIGVDGHLNAGTMCPFKSGRILAVPAVGESIQYTAFEPNPTAANCENSVFCSTCGKIITNEVGPCEPGAMVAGGKTLNLF